MVWDILRYSATFAFAFGCLLIFWKAGQHAPELPEIKRAIRLKIGVMFFGLVVLVLVQPVFHLETLSPAATLLVKAVAVAAEATVALETTRTLVSAGGTAHRRVQLPLMLLAVAVATPWWPAGPAIVLFGYAAICYGQTAATFRRFSRMADNLLFRWQFQTLFWGYVAVALAGVLKFIEITVDLPPVIGAVNHALKSIATVVAGVAGLLGYLMPKWYGSLGYRLLVLKESQGQLGHLLALAGCMQDRLRGVSTNQRSVLAESAEIIAAGISLPKDRMPIIRELACCAPVAFRRFRVPGAASPPIRTRLTGSGTDGLHFSAVWDCLLALLDPSGLPNDAPVEARVIRAAAMCLDGLSQEEITAATGLVVENRWGALSEKETPDAERRESVQTAG